MTPAIRSPKEQKQHSRELHEGRLRRTFGFVPVKPPEFALPDADAWPLNAVMQRALAKDKNTPSVKAFRQFQALGYPMPETEYQVIPQRRWSFDFAWPDKLVAIEVEGLFGRHQTVAGMTDDAIKYAVAMLNGWLVLRATPPMIRDGTMLALLEMAWQEQTVTRRGDVRPGIVGGV